MATEATLSFTQGDWNLRACVAAGKVWFLANDVARALGYQHPRHAVALHVQPRWKKPYGALVGRSEPLLYDTLGRNKSLEIWITELGVYALCFGSKRRDVTGFQEWVHEEVMPVCRGVLERQ
jgi:prophage antirepressor-like protein